MQKKRTERVAEIVKRELSHIILKEIKDPDINFITITDVKLTPDLKIAKIYFSVLGDLDKRNKAIKGLDRANKYIRSEIGKSLQLRYVPELRFFYDTIADYADNIETLFSKIKNEEQESL